jgi:hypothetical protein|tara:strand:+ start:3789 stop:4724 length:936 start_codon:yes stop_codon:yes gene_type:complete
MGIKFSGAAGGGATTLNGLSDVDTTGVADTNVLAYNSGAAEWRDAAAGAGDLVSTNNLSDVANAGTSRTNLGVDVAGTDNSTDVTLAASADAILGISGQALSADTQADNTILAGPTTGGPTAPTFRALVGGDIPDLSGTYQPLDSDLTALAGISGVNGDVLYYNSGWQRLAKGSDTEVLTLASGIPSWAAAGGGGTSVIVATASEAGTLSTKTGQFRYYFDRACTILYARASVGTAPTGSTLIVDCNLNGTTIFSNQANRPTIAISGNTDESATPDTTAISDGDYVTWDIDQIGSSTAGSDLVCQLYVTVD